MVVSSKGRYAMKIMLELGYYYHGEPVKIKDVAKHQNISEKYLEQIVGMLNKAGLVKSVRGAKGGYILTRTPELYTTMDILNVVEGKLTATDSDEARLTDDNKENYVCNRLWDDLDSAISGVLSNVTLADMLSWEREKEEAHYESLWI